MPSSEKPSFQGQRNGSNVVDRPRSDARRTVRRTGGKPAVASVEGESRHTASAPEERRARVCEADARSVGGAGVDARRPGIPAAPASGFGPRANEANEGAALQLPTAGDVEQLVRVRGAMFLVTDRHGDIHPSGARELGLFYRDTRHLSHLRLVIANWGALRLSAEPVGDAYNQVDLMLSDLEVGDFLDDPKSFLHIRRRQMLDEGLVEQIVLTNFLRRSVEITLVLEFGADFADIFEVRGARRPKRGVVRTPRVDGESVTLAYDGLDGRTYETTITFLTPPAKLTSDAAELNLTISSGDAACLDFQVVPRRRGESKTASRLPFARHAELAQNEADVFRQSSTRWCCDDPRVQHVLDRSIGDLHALRVHAGDHVILGAGIPWFCAPFGRDSLIASFEALTLNPDLGVDALRTLASFQGIKYDDANEEEPGKIFHELRFGEMARVGEIPHTPYYGSIDATPLFVILVDAVHRFTGDRALLRELRPAVVAALGWIDDRSERATKLVSYQRKTLAGLENQGWKDSRAGVSFPDGRHAELPIALCEVQGYCVDAYSRGAMILATLGEQELARTYAERAAKMRDLVDAEMWIEESGRYAFAIDGRSRVVDTVVSNIGHLLWSNAATRERATMTAKLLLSQPSFSGYGIRTLAADQPVYNPLGYHNGTVWPHDNALIAAGFANYDLGREVMTVFDGVYAAMGYFRDARLPELFCGIGRRSGPLIRYPVACSPQAWSAAAPFLLIQSLLGMYPDAPRGLLRIRNPRLPKYIRRLEISGMRVGNASVSMRFRRLGSRCHVDHLEVVGGSLKTEIEID